MQERVVCSVRRFNIAYRVMLEIAFLNYNREHYTALYSRSSQEKTSRQFFDNFKTIAGGNAN